MDTVDLDGRSAQDFFDDAIRLARMYCPDWKLGSSWPSKNAPNRSEIAADPGLALLKLFSYLIGYLADVENGIAFRWQAAFYRFMDASLRTAAPAFAPLQFTLAGGQPAQTVPAGSAVHDVQTQTIRFETDEDLRVVPARVHTALTMAPSIDSYIDCRAAWPAQAASVFVSETIASDEDANAKALPHWLLLGDPVLFKYDPSVVSIEITLSGWHLNADYFRNWCDASLAPFENPVVKSSDSRCGLTACIAGPLRKGTQAYSVSEMNSLLCTNAGFDADALDDTVASQVATASYWLLARPADNIRVLPGTDTLPTVREVTCTVSGEGALAQQTAINNSILDLSNGGYPFGKSPAREDAFYVRYDKAFAYPGAVIKLHFALADSVNAPNATVDWQYWDGSANVWTSFIDSAGLNPYQLRDETSHFSKSGMVTFSCPDMGTPTVAGAAGYWVRAVLKAYDGSNGYGFQALTTAINDIPANVLSTAEKAQVIGYFIHDTKFSFVSRYQSTQATKGPFVESLTIEYAITAPPASLWRHNAFELDRLASKGAKSHPFLPLPDTPSMLYIGFDCDDVIHQWVGERVSLYFEIENERTGEGPALSWEWLDAEEGRWRPLAIEDRTAKLARSASVRFKVPDGMREAVCFSRKACWLRVSGAGRTGCVRMKGIYINTTGAFNVRTYTQVILGSSNGLPDQRFLLPFAGVHELQLGEPLEERNVGAQPDIQLQVFEPAALDGNLQPEDASVPTAVGWECVPSFAGVGPKARVFTVEGRSGTVTFGNGVQGMIPPSGTQNIIVTHYSTTDGKKGNVPAGSLGLFAAGIPGVAEVNNPVDARGGVNGEDVNDLVRDAPSRVRANGHAITLVDYQSLAEEASARVFRVVALSKLAADDGSQWSKPSPYVDLVVLAKSDEPRADTAPSVLDDVLSYVRARSPIQMQSRINARSPRFKPIDVYAVLTTNVPPYQWEDLKATISTQLKTFLHPVGGGGGQGWHFGEPVQCMDVSTLLRGLDGIVGVDVLTLCGEAYQVTLDEDQVPTPGSIALTLEAA